MVAFPRQPLETRHVDDGSNGGSRPPWQRALDEFHDELQGIEDYRAIQAVHSLDELVDSLSSIPAALNCADLVTLKNTAYKLKIVDDFSSMLAECFGTDAALTASLWGSIRIILVYASSSVEVLKDVLDMLEELSLMLPRPRAFEHALPLNPQLQNALVDVYGETICFYARLIYFLRSNPSVLRKNAWPTIQNDFSRTAVRIKGMSRKVETGADKMQARLNEERWNHILEALAAIKASIAERPECQRPKPVQFNNVPSPPNAKFSGRGDVLDRIRKTLNPGAASPLLRSMALFGMGGVGKTQIALQYAYESLERFDVVLWIAADDAITIQQSFRAIADRLGLPASKKAEEAFQAVKKWLIESKSSFLVVFDNANDLAALKKAWPTTTNGSVLLTTRDSIVASNPAAQCFQVDALGDGDGSSLLLKAAGMETASSQDVQHALAISQAFGGLPLALIQVGGFIFQRKMSPHDFLPLYERYSAKIDARAVPGNDYEHTLSTVWDSSFEKLSGPSACLLGLLSFFDPDAISEDILLHGSEGLSDEFAFLSDEFDLGDALEELLREALVKRTPESLSLSLNRLVQSAARKRLDTADHDRFLDVAVHMLCRGFPDHSAIDIGHQISTWTASEKCLPHVTHLVGLARRGSTARNRQQWADLLLRCSWHLYEKEMYTAAREMVEQAISTFEDTSTLSYSSATDLAGLIDLDLVRAAQALEPFKRALEIRWDRLGPDDPFIAYSLNNVALAYTEMGELDLAHEAHKEAIDLRLKAESDRIGNSYSNMSSLLLRMGRPDEAEEMLARCPSLKDFTDETFLATGNPRFSGDMVLLSRIRLAQSRTAEALRLASKALAFRRQLLGNRLKTCDSQYDVACMLAADGHESSAIQLLDEVVGISETLAEGDGQRARALYKLSELHEQRGMPAESAACRDKAIQARAAVDPALAEEPFDAEHFSKLCPWMLW